MADDLPVIVTRPTTEGRPLQTLGHLPCHVSNVASCRRWQCEAAEPQLQAVTNSPFRPIVDFPFSEKRTLNHNRRSWVRLRRLLTLVGYLIPAKGWIHTGEME